MPKWPYTPIEQGGDLFALTQQTVWIELSASPSFGLARVDVGRGGLTPASHGGGSPLLSPHSPEPRFSVLASPQACARSAAYTIPYSPPIRVTLHRTPTLLDCAPDCWMVGWFLGIAQEQGTARRWGRACSDTEEEGLCARFVLSRACRQEPRLGGGEEAPSHVRARVFFRSRAPDFR